MLRKLFFLCILCAAVGSVFADNVHTTIEINGVKINGGSVYVAVYSNEKDYKDENAFMRFILDPVNNAIARSIELPNGEYVVSVFQDTNSNGKLDTNIFGIPKEPVGITNYNGRGIPGGFQKLKVTVNSNTTKITVNMGNIR